MSDAALVNLPKYKAGFTTAAQKKDFIKTSPFKIVSGFTPEIMKALGMNTTSHPTPVNSSKQK